MFWTVIVMLLLVATGGFISYYGDLQGRRWGKRRVSWFGMRPKHTAILITSLTGAVIAFLTVGAVMLVVPNVAQVVLHGEAAISENQRIRKQTKTQVDALEESVRTSRVQLATTRAAADEMNRMARDAKLEMDKLKLAKEGLDKKNGSLIGFNMDLQRQGAGLERSIQKNQKVIAEQKKEIANTSFINTQLARQNTDYARANSVLGADNEHLQTVRKKLQAANAKLTESNTELKAANENLLTEKSNLQKTYAAANNAYNGLLDETQKLQSQAAAAKSETTRLKNQLTDLSQRRDDLYSELVDRGQEFARTYLALRQTRYNLRADTELARRTLDAHLSPKAAREELMTLLNAASDRARQFGASTGANGRTVAIVAKRVVTPASVQMADEKASIDAIVDTVAASNTPVVVVARAINNSMPSEQVVIELSSFTSTIVFKQGEVVANRAIDSRQPIEGLVGSVVRFLREDVRNAAIKAGTIPQISPENGEEEVGMIETPEMVTLLDRIRRMGGNVQLTAIANDTLTSADLLTFGQARGGKPHNLRFELKRVQAKATAKSEAAVQ